MEQAIRGLQQQPVRGIQKLLGLGIAILGAAILIMQALEGFQAEILALSQSAHGIKSIQLSALAGAATGLGGLAVLILKKVDEEGLGYFMAISGGMMTASAVFSLLLPAISLQGAELYATIAALAGFALMALMDQSLPHLHPMEDQASDHSMKTAMLTSIAIGLHNIPEGFAVGAAPIGGATGTAVSIGIQNIPEGMIVATALWAAGLSKWGALGMSLATGLLEPLGSVFGAAVSQSYLMGTPVAMGLAAGAMMFVVFHEIWPEAERRLQNHMARLTMACATAIISAAIVAIG